MTAVKQQDYLKKYLDKKNHKSKEKKKRKISSQPRGFNLIEDAVDLKTIPYGVVEEDCAPTVAEITYEDEKAKLMDQFPVDKKKWKVLNGDEEISERQHDLSVSRSIIDNTHSPTQTLHDCDSSPIQLEKRNSDLFPVRRKRHDSDSSPAKRKRHDADSSPVRLKRQDTADSSHFRRKRHDSDASPVRHKRHDSDSSSVRRKRHDSDASPVRRKRHDSDSSSVRRKRHDSDASPVRRKRHDSDSSPVRCRRHDSDSSPIRRKRYDSDSSPIRRKRNDSDSSPVRRKRHDSDSSPVRRKKQDTDSSPFRRKRHDSNTSPIGRKRHNSDLSPVRRKRHVSDSSPRRRRRHDSDSSPVRRKKRDSDSSPVRYKSDDLESFEGNKNGHNNLAQDDRSLSSFSKKKEGAEHTRARGFKKLHGKKTRELTEEEKALAQKMNVTYQKWNKGVVQVQKQREDVDYTLHEMGKSFARSADDNDMNNRLKNVLRQDDPMLEYIMKKKGKESTQPTRPTYKGSFLPNRFHIAPGYRWDGVDRSNGFEKDWFNRQSSKRAADIESYKWSIEDM